MNNTSERARVRAARPVPSRAFAAGIAHTLRTLPERKAIPAYVRPAKFAAMAAGLLLLAALAGPPIARAAGELWNRLFADRAQELRQEQALPESRRVEIQLTEREQYNRTHAIEAAGEAGGVRVVLDSFSLNHSEPEYSTHSARGEVLIVLRFPDAPAGFDPAWLDFALEVGGQSIPMLLDGNLPDYRATGAMAGEGDGWGNVHFEGGVMRCQLAFPYDAWDALDNIDFVLVTQINGQPLRLPFTYDVMLAHEAALAEAQAGLAQVDEMQAREALSLEQIAASAVPIGITAKAGKAEATLEEMSIVDGAVHFSLVLRNDGGKRAKFAAMDYGIDDFRVDGLQSGGGSIDAQRREDGSLLLLNTVDLIRDPRKLPEESLFCMRMDSPTKEGRSVMIVKDNQSINFFESTAEHPADEMIVYRYNWTTHAVRLPKDQAEKEAWLAENQELSKRWQGGLDRLTRVYRRYYWIPEQPITQTVGDVTLALDKIWLGSNNELHILLSSNKAKLTGPNVFGDTPATVDGIIARAHQQDGPRVDLHLPMHFGEMEAPMQIAFELLIQEAGEKPFRFDFTFDPAKIQVDETDFSDGEITYKDS